MNSGVYIIKNKVNGKVYVGSSINIKRRWIVHKTNLRKGKHHSPLLQHSWNKHGEDNFEFIFIEPVKNSLHLVAVEQTFLDYYKSYEDNKGYNISKNACNPMLGRKHSPVTKRKMSETAKGENNHRYGTKHSEQHKKKMSEAMKGIIHSPEACHKMRMARNPKGYHYHKASGKYAAQISINGKKKYLGLYNTSEEARTAYLQELGLL